MAVVILFAASSAGVLGQGQFSFNNRVGSNPQKLTPALCSQPIRRGQAQWARAFRFSCLPDPTDAPQRIASDRPALDGVPGPARSPTAGYVTPVSPTVAPRLPYGAPAVVLIRVFDGASWDAATYRFERDYRVSLGGLQIPPFLPLGTSPIVLQSIPEPSTFLLALLGLSTVTFCIRRRKTGVTALIVLWCGYDSPVGHP